MNVVEIMPEGATARHPGAVEIQWRRKVREADQVRLDIDPFLTTFGNVPAVAVDLARVAVGAYFADRLIRRSVARWSRDITLVVHVIDRDTLLPGVALLEQLLAWVSGDEWLIRLVQADSDQRPTAPVVDQVPSVSLASGGLDSLCGAILQGCEPTFLGIRDNKGVTHAQSLIRDDLCALWGRLSYQQVRIESRSTAHFAHVGRAFRSMPAGWRLPETGPGSA